MKAYIKILAFVLLIFNAVGALFGGFMLIIDPSGGKIQLPSYLLENSPFNSYLIPGIVLFLFIGVLSTTATVFTIMRHRLYPMLIIFQGIILAIWLLVQINIIQVISTWHYIMGFAAILLIGCGWMLNGSAAKSKIQ